MLLSAVKLPVDNFPAGVVGFFIDCLCVIKCGVEEFTAICSGLKPLCRFTQ